MLTPDEQAAFALSTHRVATAMQRALHTAIASEAPPQAPCSPQPRPMPAAVVLIAQLHRSIDKVVIQAANTGPPMDCKAGCAHCCRLPVQATAPEVFVIAQHLRQQPPEQLARTTAALRQRLEERAQEALQPLPTGPVLTCTFLEDARCSIYAVRPAVCRKAHSLQVQACERHADTIEQNLALLLDAQALIQGTNAAYEQLGFAMQAHELLSGVLHALTDPLWMERWASTTSSHPSTLGMHAQPHESS